MIINRVLYKEVNNSCKVVSLGINSELTDHSLQTLSGFLDGTLI
jgi:hypothetical protein